MNKSKVLSIVEVTGIKFADELPNDVDAYDCNLVDMHNNIIYGFHGIGRWSASGGSAFSSDLDELRDELFDNSHESLFNIFNSFDEVVKHHYERVNQIHFSFLALWETTISEYHDPEWTYPEVDYETHLIGPIDTSKWTYEGLGVVKFSDLILWQNCGSANPETSVDKFYDIVDSEREK